MRSSLSPRAISINPGLIASVLLSLLATTEALAAPGDITLASTSDSGTKGNHESLFASLSADGTVVAFQSKATNLDPGDTDGLDDVYVKDLATGNITLASTSDSGVKGNDDSFFTNLSAGGSLVAFQSNATNLDPGDTDGLEDVYVKDPATGNITLASTSDSGVKGNARSSLASLSADGSLVAFHSTASNLDPGDTDFVEDVYVKNLATGDIRLASTSDSGVKGNSLSFAPSLSADGTVVAFESFASNLDPGDTNSDWDIYVKDLTTEDITLASTSDAGTTSNSDSFEPSLSADGTRVAFRSFATNLDPGDTDVINDVYVKDLPTGDITLASTSDGGTKGNGDSIAAGVSADGTRVAFQSVATNLDPGDADSTTDVYVKDLTNGDITLASTSDSGIKGNSHSAVASLSDDGTLAAFQSLATNLDPGDTDPLRDVYVKELGGAAAEADLAVSVADAPDPVVSGQDVTYAVTVTNNGDSDATGVGLVDTTSKAGKVRSVTTTQGTCTLSPRQGKVVCALGTLPDDASANVEIVVTAVKPRGTITNTATVSGNEPDPIASNNSDSESTTIAPS